MEEEVTVQIESDASKPERVLRPIMYVSWLLGVGVARPKRNLKAITIILRLIHFGICSVIVAFSAMDFKNFGKEFTSKIFEIMYCMNQAVSHISSYYYVYHVMRHYDKWPELMAKIESLDRKIRMETPINDRCVKIRQIFAILTVFALGPLSLVIHVLYYYFTRPDQIFASDLLLYYSIAQSITNSCVFDIVVYIICHRFRIIKELIKQMDEKMGPIWTALKIRKIRELHSEACCLVLKINDIYGIDVLFCSANSFITIVAKLFRIYMSAAEHKIGFIFLNNIIWMVYGAQFVVMCWVCTLTQREIYKIGIAISRFILNNNPKKSDKSDSFRISGNIETREEETHNDIIPCDRNDRNIPSHNYYGTESLLRRNFERDCVRNEVNDFWSQLKQHRVVFTACDFFEMDNSLLTRFVSVITTYLIILVQFYKPEEFGI